MPHDRLYVNDQYPLTTEVFQNDGVTPILPISAMIDVVNQSNGLMIVSAESAAVGSGLATYLILSGSTVAQTPGRYVGYMRVQIDSSSAQTIPIPFDVLDKGAYLVVDRWRRKVEDSAPSDLHDDDEHGRDWVDQAIDYLNRRFTLGYTSVLGSITPTPTTTAIELISEAASIMARHAWWAGKGNWRDAEMSFNGSPFAFEWERLEGAISNAMEDGWYSDTTTSVDMYNRDDVYYDGVKYDSPLYWYLEPDDTVPDTNIPVP